MFWIVNEAKTEKLSLTPYESKEHAQKALEQLKIDASGTRWENNYNNAIIIKK